VELDWDERASLCVVLAAAGYPGSPRKGDPIHGLDELGDDVLVDHAGTRLEDGLLLTAGGRVLALGARGDDVASARQRAYEAVAGVRFEGMQYRTDIGAGAAEEGR
ncbi:MAG: phosphoribosylamine--glycine ligase, partial [bacterium]|nr:phosphoribosylamine--glycine ligase [bacterium]